MFKEELYVTPLQVVEYNAGPIYMYIWRLLAVLNNWAQHSTPQLV